jgi:hypothetical protein
VVSPDGEHIVYVDYQSSGYGLRDLLLDAPPLPLPTLVDRADAEAIPEREPHRDEPYNPFPTLWPRAYSLNLAPGAFGQELSVDVSGADIAAFHDYSLHLGFGLDQPDKPEATLYYRYDRTPLQPSIQLYRRLTARSDLEVAGKSRSWVSDSLGIGLGASYVFASILRSQSLDLSYSLAHIGKAKPFGGELDPNDPPPRLPVLGWMPSAGFGYRYSDLTSQAYDISPSGGRTLTFHVDVTDPIMGRDLHTVTARWELRQFFALPWLAHHVLGVRYAGGLAGGDPGHVSGFSVGGFPPTVELPSLYDLLVYGSIPSLDGTALRGYAPGHRSGPQFHQLQLEYRLPIFDPEWGIYTLPFYIRRLFATVFTDAGDAFTGPPKLSDFLVGSGAELFAELVLGYRMTITVRLGMARGWTKGGETQGYLHLGTPF